VRERLVSQRTGITNQIRAFLLERSIAECRGVEDVRFTPKSGHSSRDRNCVR